MNAPPLRVLGLTFLLLMMACERHQAPLSNALQQEPPSEQVQIFPGGETLPANHLKFYVDFPEAMARGDIFEHFSLTEDGSNKTVPDPFREIELWDESGRRLTLWFHPGRQKPGVNLNIEIGPILEEGKNYTLTISGDWQTESGQTLGKDTNKSFHVGAIDNVQPHPDKWKYSIPASGTTDAFTITFPAPLDYALIPRTIQIQSKTNPHIRHQHNDRAIHFTPATLWKSSKLIITIDPKLEDLSGNSIARPFNLDLQSSPEFPEPSTITRTFEIK